MYNKSNSIVKGMIKKGGVIRYGDEVYTPEQLLEPRSNITKVWDGKKHWNKIFTLYTKIMNPSVLDYGYCILWSNYGLTKDNVLNDEYLEILKKNMSEVGVYGIIKRLVDNKMIARVKRGKYVLNPNIVHFGDGFDKSVYDLFK